jgi:glyceraldehyde 3-phosphate dehydrogenase
MALNIGINGFGGLGRLVFLRLLGDKNVTITAINDTAKPELLAYRLKYDTTAAPLAAPVRAGAGFIEVKGREIRVLEERDPAALPWKKLKTDLVLECGGLDRRQAAAHIEAGAKRVLLSGGEDLPLIVYGVNEKTLGPKDRIIAAGGPLLNSLVLVARILHETAPIRWGFFMAIQAGAGEGPEESRRLPAETPPRNRFRCFRSVAAGLVPGCTGAAGAAGLVIPGLAGRLTGTVLRSPAAGGSSLVLGAVVQARAPLDAETINRAFKAKSNKVLGYNDEEIVSSDTAGIEYGALFDATQTLVLPLEGAEKDLYQVQAAAWYDTKSSAAAQLVRIVKYLSAGSAAAGNTHTRNANTGNTGMGKIGTGKSSSRRSVADRIGDAPLHRKPLINYQR